MRDVSGLSQHISYQMSCHYQPLPRHWCVEAFILAGEMIVMYCCVGNRRLIGLTSCLILVLARRHAFSTHSCVRRLTSTCIVSSMTSQLSFQRYLQYMACAMSALFYFRFLSLRLQRPQNLLLIIYTAAATWTVGEWDTAWQFIACVERWVQIENQATTPFSYCSSMAFLPVRPQNARRNKCREDLSSFFLGELEETTGTPSYYFDEDYPALWPEIE